MKTTDRAKKILIVDDERTLHAMCKPVFEMHGFEVLSAMTGEEGLAMALKEIPDIVILDVIMPKMKGREVCQKIKSESRTRHIPVLFLTAKDSDDDVAAERRVGALGHITKPVNPAHLVKRVKEILQSAPAM